MDEFMLMEYLKSKGVENMSEHEFIDKFKDFIHKHSKTSYMRYNNMDYPMDDINYRRKMYMHRYPNYDMPYSNYDFDTYNNRYTGINRMHEDIDRYPMDMNTMYSMKSMNSEHFDESYAKHIVSNMFHTENGRKHSGEKFSMTKAREVQERYRGMLPVEVNVYDIYVAINAQYHDYCELFKSWFGTNIESKIIESAIVFWFKDTDYSKGFKLTEYFK